MNQVKKGTLCSFLIDGQRVCGLLTGEARGYKWTVDIPAGPRIKRHVFKHKVWVRGANGWFEVLGLDGGRYQLGMVDNKGEKKDSHGKNS